MDEFAEDDLMEDLEARIWVIYSFTIVYVGFGHMAHRTPYALVQVLPDISSESRRTTESLTTYEQRMEMGVIYPEDARSQNLQLIAIGEKVCLKKYDPEVGNLFKII